MMDIEMDNEAPYLPEEIIRDILKRLPVKSLIRFQSVCKEWNNLFKTPSFIKEHLHHSTHKNHYILFKHINPSRTYLINHDLEVLEYRIPPFTNSSIYRIFPSIDNGLVLLQLKRSRSFCVWNPATREVHHIARLPSQDRGGISYFGSGFTPTLNDYKIVRVFVGIGDRDHSKVEVFSLNTRSWKKLEVGRLVGIISTIRSCGFTFDGIIFWPGYRNGTSVVSFDLSTELFELIVPPNSNSEPYFGMLTTYQNKLALLSQNHISRESYSINLSVMEKCVDGSALEKCVWNKIYTSNIYPYSLYPMTVWGNEIVCIVYKWHESIRGNNVVLVNDGEPSLVLCNLQTNEFKEFGILSRYCPTWNYVESIIPDPAEMILRQNESGGSSTQKSGPIAPRRSLRLMKRPRTVLELDNILI